MGIEKVQFCIVGWMKRDYVRGLCYTVIGERNKNIDECFRGSIRHVAASRLYLYDCENGFFKLYIYIYMYNIHTTRSLFYGLWESRVYENTYNVSTARFKNFQLVPTYHRVTSPQFSECIDKWEWIPIFDTVVVSTSNTPSVRRRKVDLPLLFWRKPCLSLKKGYLAYLGSWL